VPSRALRSAYQRNRRYSVSSSTKALASFKSSVLRPWVN
jgi:hypothetical protein